jgi:hypothetical protein
MMNLQIQCVDDVRICPVEATLRWLARRKTLEGVPSTFLVSKGGKPVTNSQLLSPAVKSVFNAAHIPLRYAPYTIKHASISALYGLGFPNSEINLFTGHSELADTTARFYLKSFGEWPGKKLAAKTLLEESEPHVVPDPSSQ